MNQARERVRSSAVAFTPELRGLPRAQRQLWPVLADLPTSFVLYGGTGLALRLAHRVSVDFDLFCSGRSSEQQLFTAVPDLETAEVLDRRRGMYVVRWRGVKVAFFWGRGLRAIEAPEAAADNGLLVASLSDLAATTCKALLDRTKPQDYEDIAALLENGIGLEYMFGCARALYGNFNPHVALRALTYFEGPELATLLRSTRRVLTQAAAAVTEIPQVRAGFSDVRGPY